MKPFFIGSGGLLLFFSGLPLFLFAAGLGFVLLSQQEIAPELLSERFLSALSNQTLWCIPCFIFQGMVLSEGQGGKALTQFLLRVLGPLPGGVGVASVLTSGFFSALSGSSPSALVASGGLLKPSLTGHGMKEERAVGLLTIAGSLGVLLPPSVPVIVFVVIVAGSAAVDPTLPPPNVDVVSLFKSCAVAALGLLLIFSVLGGLGLSRPTATSNEEPKQSILGLLFKALPVLVLPVGVLYLVLGGQANVQEASALGAAWVVLLEVFVYRSLFSKKGLDQFFKAVLRTASMTAAILLIVATSNTLNYLMTQQGIGQSVTEFLTTNFKHPIVFLLALNVVFLIAGCLMDLFAALLLFVPLILPAAQALGIDMTHLGVIILLNLEAGFVTPPFGINLFASSVYFKKPIWEVVKAVAPFLIAMLLWLLVVTLFPGLTGFVNW